MENSRNLNTSNNVFNYENLLSAPDNMVTTMVIVNDNNDCANKLDANNSMSSSDKNPLQSPSDKIAPSPPSNNNNTLLRFLSSDYNGPIIIIAECTDSNKNLRNWHYFRAAKFFSTYFTEIVNIKPTDSKKIKITFDSIANGNLCLKSNILKDHGILVYIPSNLIYLYGVIRLDNTVSESEFWEGLRSSVPKETFKRILMKKMEILFRPAPSK